MYGRADPEGGELVKLVAHMGYGVSGRPVGCQIADTVQCSDPGVYRHFFAAADLVEGGESVVRPREREL